MLFRSRRSGWRVAIDPSLTAFHVGGGTPQLQRDRVMRFYKTRWYLLRKYGLITHVAFARTFVLARLRLEKFFLQSFGRILFRNADVLADKILARESLITYCRDHYH